MADRYRNRINIWDDYFTCCAYVNTWQKEETGDEVIREEKSITVETRYAPELADVTSTGYRIIHRGEVFNIQSVDAVNYQRKMLKFKALGTGEKVQIDHKAAGDGGHKRKRRRRRTDEGDTD